MAHFRHHPAGTRRRRYDTSQQEHLSLLDELRHAVEHGDLLNRDLPNIISALLAEK